MNNMAMDNDMGTVVEGVVGADGSIPPGAPVLAARAISKSYRTPTGERLVLEGIDLEIARGELVTIVGPSGAGKTTLLRCLSGLLQPTSGEVTLAGGRITRPPEGLSVVFQDYSRSLMPWLTVQGNIMLPLRSKGLGRRECQERALKALSAVGLEHAARQHPWQLSGGMQQRVAIARALAYEPTVLVMDEPFASVDAQTRGELEDLTLDLRHQYGVTIVVVTHDIDESVYLGDRVLVLSGSPTRVRAAIKVDLPTRRDQLSTKALPRFAELRAEVLQLVRGLRDGEVGR